MAPEARGTHEASRRAENTVTGHTRLFLLYLLTILCCCAYVFFLLLLVFPPSGALRIRRDMQFSITVTPFPDSAFRPWRAPRPSRASCPSRPSAFLPFAGSLVFASWFLRGLHGLCPILCSLAFERFAPCSQVLQSFSSNSRFFSSSLVPFERFAPCSQIF